MQSSRRVFPGSGALREVFSLQSTGCFLSRQAMRNFCRVLISQIKYIKRWCRQPSLTQIRLCTAKPLHTATDQCNWQPKVAAKCSSLLRRWCKLCRCRVSLLSMYHQPEAPQPGPQSPDPHPPMLIGVNWVFPLPLDSLSLPTLGYPKNKKLTLFREFSDKNRSSSSSAAPSDTLCVIIHHTFGCIFERLLFREINHHLDQYPA